MKLSMKHQTVETCPCGSGIDFLECCSPLLKREKKAETAQQLMRSRYSAFYKKDARYLMDTLYHSKRSEQESAVLQKAVSATQWLKLNILSTEGGLESDQEGVVEFSAYYKTDKVSVLREISRFIKEEDTWFYVDGQIKKQTLPGRNDPCWCGSGKKSKKCHGS